MSLQNPYSESLKPKDIIKLRDNKKLYEFMNYFRDDYEVFIDSCSNVDDLITRFSEIRNKLSSKDLLNDFIDRINFHSRLANYKSIPIQDYLRSLWNNYINEVEEIHQFCQDNIRINITFPISEEELESLNEQEKDIIVQAFNKLGLAYINFITLVIGLINVIFSAFELECKIICSLGCFAFSINYAKNNIIQHKEVWNIMRRLSRISSSKSINCEICQMQNNCNFLINFKALANIYCYAIKIRMLADYDEVLFKEEQTWYLIKDYFEILKDVIIKQENIKTKCMGEI
ncbi:hypothetical protein LCGC14_0849750 [marine sediment metagenome]|uniref:Uncharacterized protein n=1 Tax=marine sediment metagenome TaxID=412755 RepID=A0A0F9PVZ1_9ZZZZ